MIKSLAEFQRLDRKKFGKFAEFLRLPHQAGFTLIEMSISLFIVGVIFSGALLLGANLIQVQKINDTKTKIALIENALSSYAQQHYRLPCPADPQAANGQEVNGGKCFNNATNATLYWATEGIVPWKELGLPQEMVMDAWQHYITYKPAPQLTVDNTSTDMMDTANNDASNDVHNACRTAIWYNAAGEHVSRAKALFCCNAAPKTKYIATNGLSALSADWQQNGAVDTQNAAAVNTAGTSMPAATPVALTGNWMDSSTVASVHGSFQGYNSSKPEPPLMRATGLAVTLISHGGNGSLAFIPEQIKTNLSGGANVNVGAGVTNTTAPLVETENVWPPHIFSGVFGHPKVADGSYDQLNSRQNASDDIVVMLRSDDLFARVGQGSCERPPAAVFQPVQPCVPTQLTMTSATFNPASGPITMSAISLAMQQNQGIPYVLKSVATRLIDDAGYNNSLGVYVIATDGSIQGVQLITQNMHSLQTGQSATASSPVAQNGSSIGIFALPNGDNVNNHYSNIDMTSLKMVYHFGQVDERTANVSDTSNVSLVAKNTSTGLFVPLHGANNDGGGSYVAGLGTNGIYHMYSSMNDNQVSHGWRSTNINPKSVLNYAGPDQADNTKMQVGFEDLAGISCYFTNSGTCVGAKPPQGNGPTDAAMDQYGGYMANIGDNDYDDVAVSMSMTQCALQN